MLWSFTGSLDLDALVYILENGTHNGDLFGIHILSQSEQEIIREVSFSRIQLAGLFIIGGAIGKSAQFPLQGWLPDAMEGPTPVSSLIHAATMVAAGVYLVGRIFFILDESVLISLGMLGVLTAFMAAIAAMTQWDIKKVLAYSTISQLGYMMMGMGAGAYDMAFFHLFTHAFFKCGLFLVAGAIIHARVSDSEGRDGIPYANDMRTMGAIRKKSPLLFGMFLVLMLALAGLPLFSGFLSKDGILLATYHMAAEGGKGWLWVIPVGGFLTAGITAFYMIRKTMMVFFGADRGLDDHFHQPGWKMMLPIGVMAIFSLWFWYSLNPLEGSHSWLLHHLVPPEHVFGEGYAQSIENRHGLVAIISLCMAIIGGAVGYYLFRHNRLSEAKGWLRELSFRHFFLDEIYEKGIASSVFFLARLGKWIDKYVIDGLVNGIGIIIVNATSPADSSSEIVGEVDEKLDETVDEVARVVGPSIAKISSYTDKRLIDGLIHRFVEGLVAVGKGVNQSQSGFVQRYLVGIMIGVLIIGGIVFWRWKSF